MAEYMGDIEIRGYMVQLQMATRMLLPIPAEDLLRQFTRGEALGPVLEPSKWLEIRENAGKNKKAVEALVAFQKAMLEAWPEIEAWR